MRGQGEGGDGVVAARACADRDGRAAEKSRQIVAVGSDGEAGVEARDLIRGRVVLVDGDEDDRAEEFALVDVYVRVNPALGHRAVGDGWVCVAKRREFAGELVGCCRRVEVHHHRAVVGVCAAPGVVV